MGGMVRWLVWWLDGCAGKGASRGKCSKPDKRTLLIRTWPLDRGYQVTLKEGLVELVDGGKYE